MSSISMPWAAELVYVGSATKQGGVQCSLMAVVLGKEASERSRWAQEPTYTDCISSGYPQLHH